jgi:Transglutaminase-like superfamily
MRLFVESYLLLISTGRAMRRRSFEELLREMELGRSSKTGSVPGAALRATRIARSIDLACAFYPRRVLCLERSIASTLLLRRHGIAAELVLGARMLPFKSHAWVEVEGIPVNDKPYMREIYMVFDSPGAGE